MKKLWIKGSFIKVRSCYGGRRERTGWSAGEGMLEEGLFRRENGKEDGKVCTFDFKWAIK